MLCKPASQLPRQLRSVSRSLAQDVTRHLVQSLILSRIDTCNVAFASLPQRCIVQIQAVISAAAFYNIRSLADGPIRSRLRSSKTADVSVPATKTKESDRAFRVSSPCTRLEQSSSIISRNKNSICF